MNRVTVTDEAVNISIEGMVTIPRNAIAKVYLRTENMKPPGLKVLGTYLPKAIAAGTYHSPGRREFWNTHFHDECIVFDLSGFDYTCVVIDAPDAQKLIEILS